MSDLGMLHPIVLTPSRVLIAGERRLMAARSLGWESVPVRYVDMASITSGEYAENEVRKDFTPSERVAIGREIEALAGERRGRPSNNNPQNLADFPAGTETRDLAADRAGFGNRETYRQAKSVVDNGHPDVVAAMDAGELAISAAAEDKPLHRSEKLTDAVRNYE